MEGLIILFYLAIIGLFFWIWYLVSNEMAMTAEQKGYDRSRYFHFCFWLGLFGYLVVLGLKDKNIEEQNSQILSELKKMSGNAGQYQDGNKKVYDDLPSI